MDNENASPQFGSVNEQSLNHTELSGFASHVTQYKDSPIDFNTLTNCHRPSVFVLRMTSHAMKGDGLLPGSLLFVDKSLTPQKNQLVIVAIENEFYVRRWKPNLDKKPGSLQASHPHYQEISLEKRNNYMIWGVVTHSLTQHLSGLPNDNI